MSDITNYPTVGAKVVSVEMRGCQAMERHNEQWGVVLDVKLMGVYGSDGGKQHLMALVKMEDDKTHMWHADKFIIKTDYYEYQY